MTSSIGEIKSLHRQAMEEADLAAMARRKGEVDEALLHFKNAYGLEARAAAGFMEDIKAEPNRSILYRSAASLALDCNFLQDAERLICTALAGIPPPEIADELRDILEQVNFRRHLQLRGMTLNEGEIQMSIAGRAIGFGIAPADAFIRRVEKADTLLYRIAERKQGRPFRENRRRKKSLQESLELFISTPRAASFAVTFKIGNVAQASIPGLSIGEQVIDELIECLEILAHGEDATLIERINDEAYYRNFVALVKDIAPDGHGVDQVGFTAIKNGQMRQVSLSGQEDFLHPQMQPQSEIAEPRAGTVTVAGTLDFADQRKENKSQIQIVEKGGAYHIFSVPQGMMSDIVKPLWGSEVIVIGHREGKTKVVLDDIRSLEVEES